MRRERPHRRVVLLAVALVLAARPALAHGPAPAVLGAAADDGADLRVMILSRGLAQRDPDGQWRFVCSQAWNGPETVLAASADGETTFIIGNDDVFAMVGSGAPAPIGLTAPTWTLRRLVAGPDAVYALATDAEASAVWRLATGGQSVALWSSPTRHVTLASTGDALLAGSETDAVLTLDTLGFDGALLAHDEIDVGEAAGLTPSLRVAGARIFALLSRGDDYRLGVVEGAAWRELVRADSPVHGPVAAGDATVLIVDGTLYALDEADALVPLADSRRYTCLGASALGAWACAQEDFFALGSDGSALEPPRFEVESLAEPRLELIPESEQGACRSEWLDFAVEAGIDTGPGAGGGGDDGCGCSAADRGGAASGGVWAWVGVLVIWLRRGDGRARRPRYQGPAGTLAIPAATERLRR